MTTMLRAAWIVLVVASLGCGDDKDKEPPAPPITYQPAPTPDTNVPLPTPEEVPVSEDFDGESAEQITPDNMQAELERIEAEIATDTQ